ncbi:MAG: HAMP domain-containing histidine kinase [Clostridia bacterium]|nr:HAMP domain-containing histidine kinase [Clostridia bacterium]
MTKLSTFKKYFIAISITFLVCLTIIVIVLSFLTNHYLSKDKFESLSVSCNTLSSYAATDYENENFRRTVFYMARVMSEVGDNVIFVSDPSGNILTCSCSDFSTDAVCAHSVERISNKILAKTGAEDYKEIGRFDNLFAEMHFIKGKQIVSNSGINVGYVFAASPASNLSKFYSDLFSLYAFSAILPILLLFFIMYIITYRWIKPLKLMSEAAKAMAKGDFSKRIPVMSDDEIGQLSASFNQMTNSLVELETMRRNFIANVSHELKTPMTTIGGFVDGIIDGTIDSSRQEQYLKIVSNEVKRMHRLVEGMLNLSKLEAGETKINRSSFDFRELVIDVVLSQEQRIEAGKLEIQGLDGMESCIVYADRDLLHQAVYNLCDNAVKFTDLGGTVSVSLNFDSSHFVFKIKNTGAGIPEKDLPLIFDRFYKGDKARSANKDSTGLGLYLVKTIVKIHGGTVFVKSNENEYTEFGIRLPLK